MRCAVYARKSNDDSFDKSEENKSITRQVDRAREYIEKRGWSLDEEHIYIDDGISGAEFQKRHGLMRLLANLKQFDVVVCSEISRIGRDMTRVTVVIDDIIKAGVRLFYYQSDKEELFDTPEQKVIVALSSFAAEVERAKTAERTRDALERKFKAGHSAGGRCYGYRSVPIYGQSASGERIRTHVEIEIEEEEAEIVRGIFLMYSAGHGHTTIAKTLNGMKRYKELSRKYFNGKTPTSPQNGTNTWCPSCIRAMLYRERYNGVLTYGATKHTGMRNRARKRGFTTEPVTLQRVDLKIIDDALWKTVQKRLKAVRETYIRSNDGNLWGRPDTGRESKYLLSGMARCGCCGGNITILGGQKGVHYYYGCSYHVNRGATVCSNSHKERMEVLEGSILQAIEDHVLSPKALDYVLAKTMEIINDRIKQKPQKVPKLKTEIKKIRQELDHFMALIASGKAPSTVLDQISQRETQLSTLEDELHSYEAPIQFDELRLRRLKKNALAKLEEFRYLIRSNVPKARQALRKLFRNADGEFEKIIIKPVWNGDRLCYEYSGDVSLGGVLYQIGAEERT